MSAREILAAAKAAPPHRSLSRVFEELAASTDGPITVEQLREFLADRSFAAIMLFFSAINLLPLPPGSSFILAVPLILLSIQMILGYQRAWLPKRILRVEIPRHVLDRFNAVTGPWLKWFEKFIRPRYWPFTNRTADIAIGVLILAMAIMLWMPIPLGNWMPAAATFVFSLALFERDGVMFAAGVGVTIVSIIILVAVLTVGNALAHVAAGWFF